MIRINHRYIFITGLLILAGGLALSNILMSIGQFVLFFNWLAEGRLLQKLKSFVRNPLAMLVSAVYFMHLLGLLHTADYAYAIKDLRIKIPLLLLPLVISTSRSLSSREFNLVIYFFLGGVFASSAVSAYLVIIENVIDPRLASPFISHIRLSLLICLSIAYSIYQAYKNPSHRWLFIFLSVWFMIVIVLLEAFSGILILTALLITALFIMAYKSHNPSMKAVLIAFGILLPLAGSYLIYQSFNKYFNPVRVDVDELPVFTERGRVYSHTTDSYPVENGRYPGLFLCEEELKEAWNRRSNFVFDGLDRRGQELKHTIVRYMTSKNLRKDSLGVSLLKDKDILHIENGIANYYYTRKLNPYKRLLEFYWEYYVYRRQGNPSGHSAIQRIEYWKTAKQIFVSNWLIGVGTGDVKTEFMETYEKNNSQLHKQYRLRAHNQYLTMAVAFGIPGIMLFVFVLIYQGLLARMYNNYYYLMFFIVAILSMINEDTLETQAGVTFYAFFSTLLLFVYPKQAEASEEN